MLIIIISLKYDPYLVTFFLPCKLICNSLQMLVFIIHTLTSASLSAVCSSPFYDACWWRLCAFTVLSNHWSLDTVSLISQWSNTWIPESHQYHFFMFMCLCKTRFIWFILLTTSILFCFCVLLFLFLFSDLNFTLRLASTSLRDVFRYWLFSIMYWMERSCINSLYFLLSDPLTKTIFNHFSNLFFFVLIISSASSTSSNS